MADARTNHDLDSALAATLADALAAADAEPVSRTKSAMVLRHREAIVALQAKHWSWERIAEKLREGGLDVSARTVRLAIATAAGTGKKGGKSGGNAKPKRRPEVSRTPPMVKKQAVVVAKDKDERVAKQPTKGEDEHVAKPPTADGFYDAGGVEN